MSHSRTLLFTGAIAVAVSLGVLAQGSAGGTLDIYFVDTEGGQATLYVTPAGETLLVDTGHAGARDRGRILAVLGVAKVTTIDHLLLTHYHADHYGNLIALAQTPGVGHLYDHGPSTEGALPAIAAFETQYADLVRTVPRTIVNPGDAIPLAGVTTTIVASDNKALATPLPNAPEAGRPNPACAQVTPREEVAVDDNHNSAGFVMTYGRFRTVNLGDLTWSREVALMCPENNLGTVDLYLTTHHGLDRSGSPVVVHALHPRVAIMNNGTRKGGAVQTYQTLESAPGFVDLWQLHWSYVGGVEHNPPGLRIANLDAPEQLAAIVTGAAAPPAGTGGTADHEAFYLKVAAREDGSFTVTNSRNGYTKYYGPHR